jgi:catechol 2,3-dioxygenase-like lactoylglutathione lyase family enzyme
MAADDALSLGVKALRPFLPAKNFDLSQRFYAALGFQITRLDSDLSEARLGAHSFLLQNYYVRELADNFMMHVLVDDLDSHWAFIEAAELVKRFDVAPPTAPAMQPWGLRVAYVRDPSGVLWHYAGLPQRASKHGEDRDSRIVIGS